MVINYLKRREQLLEQLPEDSVAVLFSGKVYPGSADQDMPFVLNRNFYYLTGLTEPNITLVLNKITDSVTLFIDENDPHLVKWVGKKYDPDEATAISGITDVRFHEAFSSYFKALAPQVKAIAGDYGLKDDSLEAVVTKEFLKAHKLTKFPVVSVYENIIKQRMIKDEAEVALIESSIQTTRYGLENVMAHLSPHLYEYQAEAMFDFAIRSLGNKPNAFKTISAAGKNATILHYVSNNQMIEHDELLLLDLGCQTDYYCSDISRTYPASGKFTPRQREVYQAVLNVNKAMIEFARPGLSWRELNEHANQLLQIELVKLGLIKESEVVNPSISDQHQIPPAFRKYYWHSIGHSLGLDTHDPDDRKLGLLPGMVITIEPGIYIEDEAIGVRIEDNILITETGARNLSSDIIKEIDEIERYIEISKY